MCIYIYIYINLKTKSQLSVRCFSRGGKKKSSPREKIARDVTRNIFRPAKKYDRESLDSVSKIPDLSTPEDGNEI